MAITSEYLLAGVKRRISVPANQVLLENSDILAIADTVIRSTIVPMFEAVNQDYFVTVSNVALVASQSTYDIPYRAVGRALRELKIKDSATDEINIRNLAKVAIPDIELWLGDTQPTGFYFLGDQITLLPSVSSAVQTDYLEMWYRVVPSQLVETSEVATVVSVGATDITVDAVPSGITTSTPVDFVQAKSGSRIYAMDITPTATASTTISFSSSDIPSDLTAGDYIALAGYAPVVTMIPNEAYSLIESLVAKRCLKAIGDFEGAKAIDEDISEEKKGLLKLIEPRIDGEPTVIVNRKGLVRGNKFTQRRWYYGA